MNKCEEMDMIEKYYIFDNSEGESVLIAEKYEGEELVFDIEIFNQIKEQM